MAKPESFVQLDPQLHYLVTRHLVSPLPLWKVSACFSRAVFGTPLQIHSIWQHRSTADAVVNFLNSQDEGYAELPEAIYADPSAAPLSQRRNAPSSRTA